MKQDDKNTKVMGVYLEASERYTYEAPIVVTGDYDQEDLDSLAYQLYHFVDGEMYDSCDCWDQEECSIDDHAPEGEPKFNAHWDGSEWKIEEL